LFSFLPARIYPGTLQINEYPLSAGISMKDYISGRKSSALLQYGVLCRSEALKRCLLQAGFGTGSKVLDIGTADGLVLRNLSNHSGLSLCIGIDTRLDYLKEARRNGMSVLQADGKVLPFNDECFDVVTCTAVLKHIAGPDTLLFECHRVLKPGGLMIIIDPTPFGIRLGLLCGHISRTTIAQIFGLSRTIQVLTKSGFVIQSSERFMLFPLPVPGFARMETILRRIGLSGMFLYQIVCARRN
jgi:ubiquinone/menaquinone biosynthesis C-methylase UbiE